MNLGRNYDADRTRIASLLASFEDQEDLPGIIDPDARSSLVNQIVDSEQRVSYFARLQTRSLDPSSIDPSSPGFDPLKASLLHRDAGEFDEAVWLVYLYVHFGRHLRGGWRYIRDVYGRLGQGGLWSWDEVSTDPTLFRYWLADSQAELTRPGPRGFGNHRKYESLNAWEDTGTGAAVESYVHWVLDGFANHSERFAHASTLTPTAGFDYLYASMTAVRRFGRIARFDYLTTLDRLDLVDIAPPHSYIVGSTGPLTGARLLLGEGLSARECQDRLANLSAATGLGPDVLEDAVCNWQKSPTKYVRFSG